MRCFCVTLMTSLLVLLSSTAFAQTAWDVLERFGFTGVWSVSCQDMPSPQNYRMTYFKDADGLARRKVELEPDRPTLMGSVDGAQIIAATTIAVRIRNDDPNYGADNGLVFDVVMTKENDRVRTLDSKGSDGKDYIKDGFFVPSGKPSPWVEQCAR